MQLSPILLAFLVVQDPEPGLTHGPFLGHVDATSARVWARAATPGPYRLRIETLGGASTATISEEATAEHDLTLHWTASSLAPAGNYRYEVLAADGVALEGASGSFATLAPRGTQARIAFGSCANDKRFPEQPIWSRMAAEDVDAIVLLGDTPYIDSTDLEVQRTRYREFFALPELSILRNIPLYATWDDHDFGLNDTHGRLEGKERSRRAFLENHANPSYGSDGEGIYTSFRRGPVEVLLLDTRWFARTEPSPFDAEKPSLLGAAQWEWLCRGLRASDAPFKLLACGMIWNGATRPLKVDHWMAYPHEREALFQFIGEHDISGIVLVSGDIHRTRVVEHATEDSAGYAITELITSPLANTVIDLANAPHPGLVFDAGVEQTFLVVDADASTLTPVLAARILDHDSVELFRLALQLETLHKPPAPEPPAVHWYDARELTLEGRGWDEVAAPYDRLPARAEGVVRPYVWSLGRNSAGLCVRFVTDATQILGRWKLTSEALAMPHMAATGVSGLDLYTRVDDGWQWVGATRPRLFPTNVELLADGLDAGRREFLLYLPLYNGVSSVEIGVAPGHSVEAAPARNARPIVFYGTSITQGGCASRPGMAHTALLGRWLERPVINLGFSGNGTMDLELAPLLGELDAALFVVDCLPNMNSDVVRERARPFVSALREARPDVPILLVEDRSFANAALKAGTREQHASRRRELRRAYDDLTAAGVQRLHYMEGADLLGADGEATVDGSHPTDLGFLRQARALRPVLEAILDEQ